MLCRSGRREDNRNNFMVDDTLSFVNEEQYAGVSVYNGKYEFAILKNGKGQQSAKALLSVSETALAEYNAANGTNYAVLPGELLQTLLFDDRVLGWRHP